jgi:ADP-ribose pyrophosphatase YjhB (NUDIX family)
VTRRRTRVAAYGLCTRDDEILLARVTSDEPRYWTLPGGGVDHGEDPFDAVVREVTEETGFTVAVERLLGVDARSHHSPWGGIGGTDMHHVGVFYLVRIVGGELRHEVGGSTDMAAWVPMAEVPDLGRALVVDVGLKMIRDTPVTGHVPPVAVGGLLRP